VAGGVSVSGRQTRPSTGGGRAPAARISTGPSLSSREGVWPGTWHTHAPASPAGEYGKTQGGHGLSDGAAALDVRGADLTQRASVESPWGTSQRFVSQDVLEREHELKREDSGHWISVSPVRDARQLCHQLHACSLCSARSYQSHLEPTAR